MKTYSKTHNNKNALSGHRSNIKRRGGESTVKGNTISYQFPVIKKKAPVQRASKNNHTDVYSKAKQLRLIKVSGNFLVFGRAFQAQGENHRDICVKKLETARGLVRIRGFKGICTPWYKNMDLLLMAIDWKKTSKDFGWSNRERPLTPKELKW